MGVESFMLHQIVWFSRLTLNAHLYTFRKEGEVVQLDPGAQGPLRLRAFRAKTELTGHRATTGLPTGSPGACVRPGAEMSQSPRA